MPHKTTKLQPIENTAELVLLKTKLAKAPIKVKMVAMSLGLAVYEEEMEDAISGALVLEDGSGKITYNTDHSSTRQRFTIAHEIGHYALKHHREGQFFIDKKTFHRDTKSSTGEYIQEREANAFAAALLMPESLIKKEAKKLKIELQDPYGIDLDNNLINKLAKKFEVSTQAMSFRLANLIF